MNQLNGHHLCLITILMSSNVPPALMALTKTCKDNFENFSKPGGKPNFIDVDVVSCHCRTSLPPSTVPTEIS